MQNKDFNFTITKKIVGKLGRAGVICTPHGKIETPAFICVGTTGAVRYLSPSDLKSIGAQAMLSNGYHLRNKASGIAEKGGLSAWSKWDRPTITDSGGFQVMSLGSGLGKIVSMKRENNVKNTAHKERLAKVTELGVFFKDPFRGEDFTISGTENLTKIKNIKPHKYDLFSPEKSMKLQCLIGADIHMAFDELTSLADTYEYNKKSLRRTERWAKRSLKAHQKYCNILGYHQSLYGVIQGGRWEDLRRSTCKKLGQMDFDGYGLGGAFLKEDLGKILSWCNEELPENKPRHLLGLSHPDDILIGTEMGADTFDCVAPTREARHGKLYTRFGNINLRKHANDNSSIDISCDCPTCRQGITLKELRQLWKSEDQLEKVRYYRLASLHNLRFIIRLTEQIREAILEDQFDTFKNTFLNNYYSQ